MSVTLPHETLSEHVRRTRHDRYIVSLEADARLFEWLIGRAARDSDPYISTALCDTCSVRVLNR